MRVFFVDRYTFISIALILAVCAVLGAGISKSAEVYGSAGKELPIYSVAVQDRSVSITFDTAWGAEDIDAVLAALEGAGCRATFFVTGEWIEKFPQQTKKISGAGHEIANHSDSHKHFAKLSEQQMLDDISSCDEKIKAACGKDNKLVRAPYGEYNKTLVRACKKTERYLIQWSLDSLDYKGLSCEQIEKRILPNLCPGDIILFHTGTENTAVYLPEILGKIKDGGYTFKPVGELIYKDNFSINHEGRQQPASE